MKKLFILLCAVVVLASCASFGVSPGPKYTVTVIDSYDDDLLNITVPSLETVNRLSTGLRVSGMDIRILNNSSKSITVKWGDSSISYEGKSHVVFLSGRYYSDAGNRMPDSIIPAGSSVKFGVLPADNMPKASQYQADANIDPIYSKDITCGISVEMGGEMRFYAVKVVTE